MNRGRLKRELVMRWTLVQHTGFTIGHKPAFEHAVEVRGFNTPKEGKAILSAGGVVYQTYGDAKDAEEAYNYPPGNEGLVPTAKGKFVTRAGFDEPIFKPETYNIRA